MIVLKISMNIDEFQCVGVLELFVELFGLENYILSAHNSVKRLKIILFLFKYQSKSS